MARDPAYSLFANDVVAPRSITVTIDRPYWKGPKPLVGREQIVTSSAGGWKFRYNNIPIYGQNGRIFNAYMAAYALGSPLVYLSPALGKNMLVNHKTMTGISYKLSLAGAAGDSSIRVTRTGSTNATLMASEYFEINGRVHLCFNSVVYSSTEETWSIWPPLRGAYAVNTALEINDPRCLVSIVTDENAFSATYDLGNIAFVNIDFIEASWPNSTSYP